MKKLWATEEGSAVQETWVQRFRQHDLLYQALSTAFLSMLGILLPRAVIFGGCAPLGVALAASVGGSGGAVACLFSVIGYLLPSDVVFPVRYMASVGLVFGFRWALSGIGKMGDREWMAPLMTGVSLFVTGMAVNNMYGFQWDICFAQLCEALLGGGFAYFYRLGIGLWGAKERRRHLSFTEQAAFVVLTASALMGLDLMEFGGISVGRILTVVLILFAARSGQEYGGMLSGVILGATAALCMPEHLHAAVSFSVGGLFAGIFSKFGRIPTALIFGGVRIFVLLSTGDTQLVTVGAYEWLASSLLFFVLPPSVERTAKTLFCRTRSVPAVEGMKRSVELRLQYAATTLLEIAKTVDTVSEKLAAMEAPKLKSIYTDVCEHICNTCSGRDRCWREQFTDTMADFRRMGTRLRETNRLTSADIPSDFQNRCRHYHEVAQSLNRSYAHLMSQEEACKRLADMRGIVTDQFESMASLLEELSAEFKAMEHADEQMAARIERLCRKYRLPLRQVSCLIGRRHRLSVELLIEGNDVPAQDSRWFREVCDICGCTLEEPVVSHANFLTRIQLFEKPRLGVRVASCQRHCKTEQFCGDAFETFYDQDGRFCAVLSDGMGSGGRAAVDGALTAALAGRMLQAGFHADNVLRVLNSALIVKSKEESLSTLDAVQIDLFTGTVSGIKAGAAPAFLYSRGHVCRIQSPSLPIGILNRIDGAHYEEFVDRGDWLLLVSDGVISDDSGWLEALIEHGVKNDFDEQMMADEIVFRAVEQQGEKGDDTTALVLRIC